MSEEYGTAGDQYIRRVLRETDPRLHNDPPVDRTSNDEALAENPEAFGVGSAVVRAAGVEQNGNVAPQPPQNERVEEAPPIIDPTTYDNVQGLKQ